MYIVFKCRKCEHEIYMPCAAKMVLNLRVLNKLSKADCPQCGEQGYENWILKGVSDKYPEINEEEEEEDV